MKMFVDFFEYILLGKKHQNARIQPAGRNRRGMTKIRAVRSVLNGPEQPFSDHSTAHGRSIVRLLRYEPTVELMTETIFQQIRIQLKIHHHFIARKRDPKNGRIGFGPLILSYIQHISIFCESDSIIEFRSIRKSELLASRKK